MKPWEKEGTGPWAATFHGFTCKILRHPTSLHLNGYIHIPPDHPWYGKSPDVSVHGGVTYEEMEGDRWVLGFDCAHYGDLVPGYESALSIYSRGEVPIYRTIDYVLSELNDLAEQAKNARQ